MKNQKKLGLSLRGGAGRAAGYIGVFKALKESEIKVDYIIGSSMGAILGCLYAAEFSIEQMIEFEKFFQLKEIITLESFKDLTIMGDNRFLAEAKSVFGDMKLEELKTPMSIQVTNLDTRKSEVFTKGSIVDLLMASSAFPFYLPPIKYGNSTYIDGDITAGYGVDTLKNSGADIVLGLSAGKMPVATDHNSIISRFIDPILIASENFRSKDLELNPLDIHIDNLGMDAPPFCYDRMPELIDNAYKVAKERMPEIKEKLQIKSPIFYFFGKLLNKKFL